MSNQRKEDTMSQENQNKKEGTLESFNQLYTVLINYLNNLPLHPLLKQHCFLNLDQGANWARQGISVMAFPTPTPPPIPVPESDIEALIQ